MNRAMMPYLLMTAFVGGTLFAMLLGLADYISLRTDLRIAKQQYLTAKEEMESAKTFFEVELTQANLARITAEYNAKYRND